MIKIVRSGRPTDEPKILSTRIRLSEKDVEMLDFCSDKAGKKKSEIIRLGIKKVYEENGGIVNAKRFNGIPKPRIWRN